MPRDDPWGEAATGADGDPGARRPPDAEGPLQAPAGAPGVSAEGCCGAERQVQGWVSFLCLIWWQLRMLGIFYF